MTCDKCYHDEVCKALYETHLPQGVTRSAKPRAVNGVPRIGATECAYFKDKERVEEMVTPEGNVGRMCGDPLGEKRVRVNTIDELAGKIIAHFRGNNPFLENSDFYVRSVVERYAKEMKEGTG